jgi:predicted transcriptional regulator
MLQVLVSAMAEMATLQELVAQVATAYFSNVSVSAADIPSVMGAITDGLKAADGPAPDQAPPPERPRTPERAEIERSITPDALISFEDGRPYKTLRRHLTARGLTPIEYRAKHGLPDDYPMVAQNTSAARSQLARSIGLGGRKPATTTPAPESEPVARSGRRPRGAKPKTPRRG